MSFSSSPDLPGLKLVPDRYGEFFGLFGGIRQMSEAPVFVSLVDLFKIRKYKQIINLSHLYYLDRMLLSFLQMFVIS
jgi:hypothetical protein